MMLLFYAYVRACDVMLYCVTSYYFMLRPVMLCCIVLLRTTLCYVL